MSTRRAFLRQSRDGGALLLSFMVAGCQQVMTPENARAAKVDYQVLSAAEAQTLDALGETLLSGSKEAGLSHYIDQQLSAPVDEQLLMVKYLGLNPPFSDFYKSGLIALENFSQSEQGQAFHELPVDAATKLVGAMATNQAGGWKGPPPPLFYFALRSDAVDVVYGTPAGFQKLNIPYMAHIDPPEGWR